MARYKPYDVNQDKFIPISFRDQILPGSFEHALNEIRDADLELTSMQSLLFSVPEASLFGGDIARNQFREALERAIDLAGRFLIPNLVSIQKHKPVSLSLIYHFIAKVSQP